MELGKALAAGTEMIYPRINFRNRDLMPCHALQKIGVRTARSIWVRESFRQLSIEELQELPVFVVLSFFVLKANQDSPSRHPHRDRPLGFIITTSYFN